MNISFLGTSGVNLAVALAISAVVFVVLVLARNIVSGYMTRRAAKTPGHTDDLIAALLQHVHAFFLLALALNAGEHVLTLSPTVTHFVNLATLMLFLLQIAVWTNTMIAFFKDRYTERHQGDTSITSTIHILALAAHITVWVGMIIVMLGSLGLNISALVAGLGVGSLAVALALQTLLGDVLSSITIAMDKPFRIGDFIMFGNNQMGTVEFIGLRSTRIRALSGERLVSPNSNLTKYEIANYNQMFERRILTNIGVEYGTPMDTMEAIPKWIKEIIEAEDGVRFDRAHFNNYGAYSLDIQVVYWVTSPDYTTFMNHQQAINLAIGRKFEKEGVVFAFPTQTIHQPGLDALAGTLRRVPRDSRETAGDN